MLVQLAVASGMVFVTVLLHGTGIAALARKLQFDLTGEEHHHHFTLGIAIKVLSVVFGLFALHGVEIWLYAGLYLSLDAVANLETAVYFSTITYAAIGYDDSAMATQWRLVSAIEGVNGLLLLGWSTAFFVTVVARLRR
ncbi:MAG: two pore domain potassium channel family protein [Alphaproteobacteria bacterium]|nr:two pore domain potassium channel family protein [Alphaproteobacteria bacterium]